jgi:hypothetical protein
VQDVYYLSMRKHLNFEIMIRTGKTLSSQQATDRREGRRLRVWELKQEGWKQRDEEAIRRWKEERWPELEKGP